MISAAGSRRTRWKEVRLCNCRLPGGTHRCRPEFLGADMRGALAIGPAELHEGIVRSFAVWRRLALGMPIAFRWFALC